MVEEALDFLSDGVRLEGRLAYRENLVAPEAKVLLCPPHPFLGGDMDNNVLVALTQTLAEYGFVVFRFNYRGIGQSETDRDLCGDQRAFWENSTCPEYEARIFVDTRVAIQTLGEAIETDKPILVVGYSFGCLPAIRLLGAHPIPKLALISPPLTKWRFDGRELPASVSKKFFYSRNDFACPVEEMEALLNEVQGSKSVQAFEDADHFFIGQEAALATAVCEFLGAGHG